MYTIFDDLFCNGRTYNHPMNITEDEGGWNVELRATGLKKEDIQLEYEAKDNTLYVKSLLDRKKEKEVVYQLHEFWRDWFDTRIQLPEGIDPENIEARTEDGILYVRIGKKSGGGSNKRIELK